MFTRETERFVAGVSLSNGSYCISLHLIKCDNNRDNNYMSVEKFKYHLLNPLVTTIIIYCCIIYLILWLLQFLLLITAEKNRYILPPYFNSSNPRCFMY